MNIDVIVAKLKRRGLSTTNAKSFANTIVKLSREYAVSIDDLIDNSSSDMSLSELGNFLTNTVAVKGYKTGKSVNRKASDIVTRTIIK